MTGLQSAYSEKWHLIKFQLDDVQLNHFTHDFSSKNIFDIESKIMDMMCLPVLISI